MERRTRGGGRGGKPRGGIDILKISLNSRASRRSRRARRSSLSESKSPRDSRVLTCPRRELGARVPPPRPPRVSPPLPAPSSSSSLGTRRDAR